MVMRRAPRHGIDRLTTSTLLGWTIFLGLLAAHLFDLFVYYPDQFVENPWLLLQPRPCSVPCSMSRSDRTSS